LTAMTVTSTSSPIRNDSPARRVRMSMCALRHGAAGFPVGDTVNSL
jgi:hypothetical protein